MGREIRRVPSNWEHPKDDKGNYLPIHNAAYVDALEEWIANYFKWKEDPQRDERGGPFWMRFGAPPQPDCYREATWDAWGKKPTCYQVYENISEGTPVSPVFSSLPEMKEWLLQEGFSEKASEAFVKDGYAPSFVISDKGVSGLGIHSLDMLHKDD